MTSGWKGFVVSAKDSGLLQQTHGIKGLKIYTLPDTDILVADYAKKTIGEGAFKQAKSVIRMGAPGAQLFQEIVRLTPISKKEKAASNFEGDSKKEWDARYVLSAAQVPHVAGMTRVRYLNKQGQIKTRTIMIRYPSDAGKLAGKEAGISCAIDAAESLVAMHRNNLVHGDIKENNVLTDGVHGYLSDFGYMGLVGEGLPYGRGTPRYMAPETFLGTNSWKTGYTCAMDMFSFGMFLLEMIEPKKSNIWKEKAQTIEEKCNRQLEEIETEEKAGKSVLTERRARLLREYQEAYLTLHAALLKDIRAIPLGPARLICDLLSTNPAQRPTAEETLQRLKGLYPKVSANR